MRFLPLLPLLLAAAPNDVVRQTWTHLPQTRNHCDEVFDYFPGGGLRILWCHAREDLTIPQVASLAGVPIWASGPHRGAKLDLDEHRDFGHYNPEFVRKIPDFALPASRDSKFRELTQPTYDEILRDRARLAFAAQRRLVNEPEVAKGELAAYQANMKSETPDPSFYERWYDFVPDSPDGNVTKTLVAWWLRRRIDGTEARWVEVLGRLLETYDAAWLAEQKRSPSYGPRPPTYGPQ